MKNYDFFDFDFETLQDDTLKHGCVNLFGEKCDFCDLEEDNVEPFEPEFD